MGTKTRALPRDLQRAFAARLKRWVDEEFEGNQTSAGRALGFSQGHISAVARGSRGPGLDIVYALHLKTGESMDELLGLRQRQRAAHGNPLAIAESDVERIATALLRGVAEHRAAAPSEPPAPEPVRQHRKDRT